MIKNKGRKGLLLVFLVALVVMVRIEAIGGVPSVTDITVTDVTPRSFSVIWASSEPSYPYLRVYDDPDGLVPTVNAVIMPQPVESGSGTIAALAEDNGVMKVRVTGLMPNTTYYFQTATTSKSTSDVTYDPDAAPMLSVATEIRVVRTEMAGEDEVPFTNDLIVFDCYLSDGITPAEGTLLVAVVEGCNYPISGFVGDGVSVPKAYVDLNNLFDAEAHENIPLYGSEKLTLTKFMGLHGIETAHYSVPVNVQLAEMKSPASLPACDGDFDNDGDVDGFDLAVFADAFGSSSYNPSADFNNDGYVNETDLAWFAGNFGRTDCGLSQ